MGGYDIETINDISNISEIPIIASGGAGKPSDFYDLINETDIKAVSAANIFHLLKLLHLMLKDIC